MGKILTISVAAYNVEECLSKCLDSFCIPEIVGDIEVLVVNDGSTDETAKVAERYVKCYPDTFVLVSKENGGHGSTINTSIKNAQGKYFKVVDADDWVERDGISDLIERLKNLDVDAVVSPYYVVHAGNGSKKLVSVADGIGKQGDASTQNYNGSGLTNRTFCIGQLPSEVIPVMHALTFRTELLKRRFVPVDEHCFYVDLEYSVFYFSLVKTIHITDKPIYDYLNGINTQSVSIASMLDHCDDHMRVVRSLIRFFEHRQSVDDIPIQCQHIIERAIVTMYKILLMIPEAEESLGKVLSFDEELRENSPKLYLSSVRNGVKMHAETAMIVSLLRRLHFHGYVLIHKSIHSLFKGEKCDGD